MLALALDARQRVFKSGIQFSGPADQDTQIYSTAVPAGCQTPLCTYPATDALVQLVVPPYDNADVCVALDRAAALRHRRLLDPLARDGVPRAAERQGAAAQLLLGRRLARAGVRGADDGRLRGREPAAAHARGDARRARVLLRPLVAAARDPPLLQDAAPVRVGERRRDDDADREPDRRAASRSASSSSRSTARTRRVRTRMLAPYVCDTSRGKPGAS